MFRFAKLSSCVTVVLAVLLCSLLRCTGNSVEALAPGQLSMIACPGDNLMSCNTNEPKCASGAPQCVNNQCVYKPGANTTCLPPDVTFCDYTDGGMSDCTRTDGSYPTKPSLCGYKECINGTTCNWGLCIPPPGAGSQALVHPN
jgi:hypothetical protein